MLKSVIAFCLSRRAVVLFGLLAFAGAGFFAFERLNIEANPNPTPVSLEITAQAPGLSAEEMERYYTIPIQHQHSNPRKACTGPAPRLASPSPTVCPI
jgi:cobalt-zinc-cadmium resistance protein CzcA